MDAALLFPNMKAEVCLSTPVAFDTEVDPENINYVVNVDTFMHASKWYSQPTVPTHRSSLHPRRTTYDNEPTLVALYDKNDERTLAQVMGKGEGG
jgi:hypothetical protein